MPLGKFYLAFMYANDFPKLFSCDLPQPGTIKSVQLVGIIVSFQLLSRLQLNMNTF